MPNGIKPKRGKAKAKPKAKKVKPARCAAISKTTKKKCKKNVVGRSKFCAAHKKR